MGHRGTNNEQTKLWLKDIFTGLRISFGIAIGLSMTGLLAVAVSGTFNSFTSGAVIKSSEVNTNFATLKTAVEGITSSQWTTSGANIGYTAGNVGIGTTSPLRHFHIDGNNGVEQIIRNNSMASGSRTWGIIGSSGNLNIRTLNDDASVELSSVLNLTRAGNVGITTSSPAAKLTLTQTAETNTDGIRLVDGSVNWNIYSSPGARLKFESTGGANIIFQDDGKVGISRTPTTHNLEVQGSAGLTSGTAWTNISDERLKRINGPISRSLENLSKLNPILYEYNAKSGKIFNNADGKRKFGFTAQNVKSVFPEMVISDENGYLWYNPSGFEAILTAAIKELKSLHDINVSEKQKSDNRALALEKENAKLREEITTLSHRVATRWLEVDERLRAVEKAQEKQLARK